MYPLWAGDRIRPPFPYEETVSLMNRVFAQYETRSKFVKSRQVFQVKIEITEF